MVEGAIGLGLVLSLVFSETFGVAAGGMVVPGYIALALHRPFLVAGTVIASLLTLWSIRLLTNFMLVYGRRRIALTVLLGFVFGWVAKNALTFSFPPYSLHLASIGYIIPGLIAYWMLRQGIVETMCTMLMAAFIVRLGLIVAHGGRLIELAVG